jgi:hypothetical protein
MEVTINYELNHVEFLYLAAIDQGLDLNRCWWQMKYFKNCYSYQPTNWIEWVIRLGSDRYATLPFSDTNVETAGALLTRLGFVINKAKHKELSSNGRLLLATMADEIHKQEVLFVTRDLACNK